MSNGADELESKISEVLAFLHLCDDDKHSCAVSLKSMDGAVPVLGMQAEKDISVPWNDGVPAVWPIDVATVAPARDFDDPHCKWPDGALQFNRLSTVSTAGARQRGATRFSSRMVLDSCATAMPDGSAISGGGIYALLGAKWVTAQQNLRYPPNWQERIHLAAGFALTLRYEWSVWLGYGAGPRVRFVTDPTGAREVFRLRDIPNGANRRAALRNWVNAHWRKKSTDNDARSWVQRHLRGAEEFTWNGLRCKVSPPEYDLEQLGRAP